MSQELTIKVKVLNELLADTKLYKRKYFLSKQDGHRGIADNSSDGEQDEYNEYFEFYRHPEMPENLFLRVTYQSNSYGTYDNGFHEIQLVEGKAKTITVYEPIK